LNDVTGKKVLVLLRQYPSKEGIIIVPMKPLFDNGFITDKKNIYR